MRTRWVIGSTRRPRPELNRHAEGWSAGLHLGILAIADPRDATASDLTGDSGTIADYLRSEILEPLGPDLVAFLRRTSFLERLSGPLCDAVLGRTDSAVILSALERANRFVVPLDDRGVWYREHHLLRELLQADLDHDGADDVARLATNASIWFDEHGSPGEAIQCARLANDEARLAGLLMRHTRAAFNTGNVATVRRWFDEIESASWLVRHPELALTGGIYFALTGDPPRAGRWMHIAASTTHAEPRSEESDPIDGLLAMGRAIMAQNGAAAMLEDGAIAAERIPSLSTLAHRCPRRLWSRPVPCRGRPERRRDTRRGGPCIDAAGLSGGQGACARLPSEHRHRARGLGGARQHSSRRRATWPCAAR